jgi:hypothetical protein
MSIELSEPFASIGNRHDAVRSGRPLRAARYVEPRRYGIINFLFGLSTSIPQQARPVQAWSLKYLC